MKAYRLRAKARQGVSTFVMAECCKTVIFVTHPVYRGNVCMVINEACKLTCTRIPAEWRFMIKDWDKDKNPEAGELPPYTGNGP